MKWLRVGSITGLLLGSVLAAATAFPDSGDFDTPSKRERCVRELVAAFNARDLDRMLASMDEKIQWFGVDGAKLGIETDGKAALRKFMVGYFGSCTSCRSKLLWVRSAGSRVTALERASWNGKSGPVSQESLSVYEFGDAGITRVYYFPAERDSTR